MTDHTDNISIRHEAHSPSVIGQRHVRVVECVQGSGGKKGVGE